MRSTSPLSAPLGAAAAAEERPALWPLWAMYLLGLLVALAGDILMLRGSTRIEVESRPPQQIYIGAEGAWRLELRAERDRRLQLLADLDQRFQPQPVVDLVVGAEQGNATVLLRPTRRGSLRLHRLWFRWHSPLGLFVVIQKRQIDATVPVVPDLGAVRSTAVRFFGAKSKVSGLKTERYVGDGSEFESLRDHVPGLDSRSIDWKATVRHRKLMCRQFRAERNHQVVVAVDTGHLMREPIDGIPRVDHAINRALLLSYVCLKTGDRVGMYAFDAKPGLYLEPQGGVSAFERLRRRSSEIEYGDAETNYSLGILELTSRLRRRSLVVVFTEFIDSVTAQLMSDNLDRLARRHVVIFVALRDPSLEAIEYGEISRLSDLSRAVVASRLRLDRERVLRRLRRGGIQIVDARPDTVSVELINRYIEIVRREFV